MKEFSVKRVGLTLAAVGLVVGAYAELRSLQKPDHESYWVTIPGPEKGWHKVPHSPRIQEKYVSVKSNSSVMVSVVATDAGVELPGDPTTDELSSLLTASNSVRGMETGSVSDQFTVDGAKFKYVDRHNKSTTLYSAIGTKGNSDYIFTLTEYGTEKEREEKFKDDFPVFENLVKTCTFPVEKSWGSAKEARRT